MPKSELVDIEDKEENYSCNTSSRRLAISKALDLLPFYDRELLLKTHEKSLRKIAKDIGVHYVTLHKEKHKALDNLREICLEKKEVLDLGTPLRR
jgi:DNA-directed RNA polymerase specialized sigma24 family protein